MQHQIIKNQKNLEFSEGPLNGCILHPIWLRERLKDEENLDKTNLQRLYEPSLINHISTTCSTFIIISVVNLTVNLRNKKLTLT